MKAETSSVCIIRLRHSYALKMQQNDKQALALVLTPPCIEKTQKTRRMRVCLCVCTCVFFFLKFIQKWHLKNVELASAFCII